ncbi:beta-lactamase/transpeptidase-like protein [Lojkania enalia]|uniref:Beta-lactamase/transpeptidase-like protein n=1 Tax=Lojkania enalia TaxID=147567 RepID=A0A9P4MW53_9PLEO|nr:beta-lactamase/transpeptidase-like protein [Didymosphaeria enalia]
MQFNEKFAVISILIVGLFQTVCTLPVTQYYVSENGATHQTKFNQLSSQGYRMISLNVHGPSSSPLYSAVWIQRTGAAYVAIHGVSGSTYQAWFDQYSRQGYVSTIVTATGAIGSEIYAGVMEKISVGEWIQQCGLSATGFQNRNAEALSNKRILKYFDEFGTSSDRRFCGVWHTSAGVDKSSLFTGMSSAAYQNSFNSETSKPYWRPSLLSLSEDLSYSAVFTDSSVGSWQARHGLTASQLTTEVTTQAKANRYLINLTAGGSGANARYAAIFAAQDIVSQRSWRVAGTVTGFKDNSNANAQVENFAKSFMKGAGVRQVQISIGKNGNVLLDKAYTWSESERPSVRVTDRFLLASLSKAFDSAAIQKLYNAGSLSPTTTVYPLLGYSCGTGDARRCQITVQHLLDMKSGYDNNALGFDPTYSMRQIALAKSGGAHPATISEIVSYVFPYNLASNPGSTYVYNNYNYLLLSAVVEKVTGQSYFTYLNSQIITPEGLNVAVWATSASAHANDKVIQESRYTGLSALQPTLGTPVAAIYGGDGMYKESAAGPASLSASASSLTKFIYRHAVWGNGGRASGYARSGSTPGSSTWMESRIDGVDWAIVVNTRDFPNGNTDFNNAVSAITSWLNTSPVL